MKKLLFAVVIAGNLFACSLNNEIDSAQLNRETNAYPQKWELVKMTGSFTNSETTGTDMAWQEFYLLEPNHTFTKSRESNGDTKEAKGTYAFVDLSDGKYLELTYESDNELIGNCTGEPKEYLRLTAENTLVATWLACDGPGLEYKKVQ